MKRLRYLLPILLGWALAGCGPKVGGHGHSHDQPHTSDAHGHDHAETTVSHTIWTDKSELFVEYKPLVVGETSHFAAHFSEQKNFKAIREGKLTVSLIKGKKGIRHSVDAPQSPGIFRPALQPKAAGKYQLIFEIQTADWQDRIVIPDITVYASMAEAKAQLPAEKPDPKAITFLKEQAWEIEFATTPARQDTLYEVIHAGGEIMAARGKEKTISATVPGILLFKLPHATIGSPVSKGQLLFALAGGGIVDRDLETRFLKAKAKFEQASTNYERVQKLHAGQATSTTKLETAKLAFELAKTEYKMLGNNYSKGGKGIYASQTGYLKQLFQAEGAFVEAGEPLAIISETKTVTLRADVDPQYYPQLSRIHSANFISNQKTYALADLQGKLLSYGKSVSRDQPKIPVYFSLTNSANLLPGSFVEIFIQLDLHKTGILVPSTALLESYASYSVIVQTEGERFEMRKVQIGIENGRETQVLSGLAAGERVVTKGTYQVKMASMQHIVPGHGHAH